MTRLAHANACSASRSASMDTFARLVGCYLETEAAVDDAKKRVAQCDEAHGRSIKALRQFLNAATMNDRGTHHWILHDTIVTLHNRVDVNVTKAETFRSVATVEEDLP